MTTKEKTTKQENTNNTNTNRNSSGRSGGGFDRSKRQRRGRRDDRPQDEFEQKILDLSRVTRVTRGGKRMRFRACVVVGDKKGKLGVGLAKGNDVTDAINKAVGKAKKSLLDLSCLKGKLLHEGSAKYGAGKVFLKPGRNGDGIIAGGVVRVMLELSGLHDVVAKMLGGGNKINNARATMRALEFIVNSSNKRKK